MKTEEVVKKVLAFSEPGKAKAQIHHQVKELTLKFLKKGA